MFGRVFIAYRYQQIARLKYFGTCIGVLLTRMTIILEFKILPCLSEQTSEH